jgi:transposase-like protein
MTRSAFSPEFKLKIIQDISQRRKRPTQICREHNISETSLLKRPRAYAEQGEAAFKPAEDNLETLTRERILERKVAFERLVGQLTLENRVLNTAVKLSRRAAGQQ